MNANEALLRLFVDGLFPQMDCPQCENTFLTNVYSADCSGGERELTFQCQRCKALLLPDAPEGADFVLLEKRALGLEYFCDAIHTYPLKNVPYTRRIGVLSDDDEILPFSTVKLFTNEEPDYRMIYMMERLEHLPDEEGAFFSEHIYGFDWQNESVRQGLLEQIAERYKPELATDIRFLCRYFREHGEYLSWDLHGDNLMRRPLTGEIVVMDPFVVIN
uniref:Uncharacterized protein n=1 Tax=uncultured Thiotrichaceae bacterium TaxID=298394 RepID=A0A6S6UH79_9GAMM|nr:MAG: Unknown protein [uncultured Thiotrichaceae bacterium]